MKKRLFSIVLSLCIVMTFMPQMVFAEEGTSSGVYIFFDSSEFTSWEAPFYAYVYDEDADSTKTYSNAERPGQEMQVDPATGYYYIEVSDSSCIAKDTNSGEITASIFDLVHNTNTYVIISDSKKRQYPVDGAKKKLELGGSSKLLSGKTSSGWQSFSPKATITYELNGGTINSGEVTEYFYGQGAALPTDVIKTGYTFAGWYEDDDFSGSPVTEILATDTGNKTFYAKWDSINDKLISITPPEPITVENGTAYEDMNLPETVEVETAGNSVTRLPVKWDTARPAKGSYDPTIKTEQAVTLYGFLQLPDGLEWNPDIPAYTTITITIKAASGTSDDSNMDDDSKTDDTDDSNNDNESKADDEDSVRTGDNANLALWLALMLLSGAGITGTTLYTRRKRINE